MEPSVWRIFYALRREPNSADHDSLALKIQSLARCRNEWETGFSVVTPRYVIQLLEAPPETLGELLQGITTSADARLLLSEGSSFRWFCASVHGAV